MNINAYLAPIRKWWWLVLASTLIAGITSFIAASLQPPIYQSRTTLIVGQAINQPNPTTSEFYLEQQLASIYADMANRDLLRQAVMQALDLSWLPQYNARALPNTQLVEIITTASDPALSQVVANEIAHQLVLMSPSGVQPRSEERQQFVDSQLVIIEQQINDTRAEIEKLALELGTLNSARQIAEKEQQITGLENKVNSLQNTYAVLASSTSQGASNSIRVIEPAELPTYSISPNRFLIVSLACMIGIVLSCLGAFVIEYLDDTIKTTEGVNQILGAPLGTSIIGYIPTIEDDNKLDYVYRNPHSPVSDAFRILRTNIHYLNQNLPAKTILITSLGVSQGKSTMAANLAVSFSQENLKVALVDSDLRKPSLQNIFGVDGEKGLSDILSGSHSLKKVPLRKEGSSRLCLPSGPVPDNPVELLGSAGMDGLITELKDCVDVVIFDGPPLFLSDTLVLAGKVDGILLSIQLGTVRRKEAQLLQEHILQTGIRILGIVINRAPKSSQYPLYHKYYGVPQKKSKGTFFGRD